MPRPSRRGEVLAAATSCFADLGYDRTRTRDIAERAGMSEAAIYRHFDSLDDVAHQVYSVNLAEYARLVAAAVGDADAGNTAEHQLRRVVRATLARFRDEPDAFTATLIRMPNFMPDLAPGTIYPLELIESVIRRGQHAGTVRPGRTNLLASLFLGALLRPFLLDRLAAPGAFDLRHDLSSDALIEDASIATVVLEPRDSHTSA